MSMRYPGGLIATTPVNQQYPSGVWTGPQTTPYQTNNVWANDSSFKNTTLLLHGDGATTSFTRDASTNNFQMSLVGDTKPNNLTPFIENGYWSNFFNGSSDYLTMPDNANYVISGDFTVEAWIFPTSFSGTNGNIVLAQWPGATATNQSFQFYVNSTGKVGLVYGIGATNAAVVGTSLSCTLNTWNHVAVTRSGTTVRYFVNGALDATSSTVSGAFNNSTGVMSVGRINASDSGYFSGYISNCRLVIGTALYTSAFTPSTTPLTAVSGTQVLVCQSNRFIDNSSNAATITASGSPSVSMQQPFTAPSGTSLFGSGYFDGSGDYLRSPTGYLTGVTTGNFTVEGWWNFGDFTTRTTYFQRLWSFGTGLANDVTLNVDNSGNLVFRVNDSIIASQSSGAMRLNSWNHVALVRSSGTVTIYLNGTSVASAANSSNISGQAGNSFYIGCESDGAGGYFYGYCSNVRITNTAVYTTTFTPSTTPLTPVSGTSLLTLQTNGPENNSGFLDSSLNSFPITRNGNTTQGSLNPYQTTGYWSNAFDGSGDYLTIPSSSTFSFTGDFTWEAWVYLPVTTSGAEIVSKHLSGITGWYMLVINGSLAVQFVIWNSSNTSSTATSSSTIKLGQWNHIAGGRNGSTVFACLNGVYTSSALTVTPRTTNNAVNIGANLDGSSNSFNGYISNLRCASYAVYTGNYTVPTAPLTAIANTQLLTCQSNRFKDNSSNNFALTSSGNVSVQNFQPFTLPALQYTPQVFGGSGYFDGNGDWLETSLRATTFGSSNFTIECWLYYQGDGRIYANYRSDPGNVNGTELLMIGADIYFPLYQSNTNPALLLQVAHGMALNTWNHIAVTRSGSTFTIWVNGVSKTTGSYASALNAPDATVTYIGRRNWQGNTNYLTGYLSNFRVVIGTALYSATFTPPTAPLTAVANTSLLLSCANAAIFDNSGMNNLETVGNAQIDTSVVKYGASSMYFDGSGDYLVINSPGSNIALGLGAVDFTVEFWVYFNSGLGSDIVLYDGRPLSTNGVYPTLYVNSSSQLSYVVSGSDRITSGLSFTTNTWYHVALARFGTTTKMFINGTQVGSNYTDSNNYLSAARRPVIAINGFNETAAPLNGYIDDLRVTKGVARYVGNFTPPVARMPNQ
jgi:hypothetical protein